MLAALIVLASLPSWARAEGSALDQLESLAGRAAREVAVPLQAGVLTRASPASAPAGRFQGILEEVIGDGDGLSDLSQAEAGLEFAVCSRIQFRDSGDGEFQDYKGKPAECSVIIPDLVAVDLYWSSHFPEDGQVMTRMESFYLFRFRVLGRTLRWHRIFQGMTWVKGDPPLGREMDVVGHEEHVLEAGGTEVATRLIGGREFRISIGFFSRPRPIGKTSP